MRYPADPALVLQGLAPRIHACLEGVVSALDATGEARLPEAGAHTSLLARAVYRWWLAGRPWAPFVRGSLPPTADPALWWGPPGARAAGGVEVITVDPSSPLDLDPRELEVLARLDAGHLAATDPSLAQARARLLPEARAGRVVYLQGPLGSGRASLAAWAVETALLLGASERARAGTGGAIPARQDRAVIRDLEEQPEAERERVARQVLLRSEDRGVPPGRGATRPPGRALAPLVGRDPAFCRVLEALARHAPGDARVLLLGERGVGKELFAKALHDLSERRGRFVPIDLASRPSGLLEADLFGHVRGAYTGSAEPRLGAVREADGGTLFLDEVGNLPWEAQGRLLRLLESSEVVPVGSDRPLRVNVRVVAATNVDLQARAEAGTFRADLYDRLAWVVLRIPPLRERRGDILELARHFLAGAAELTPEAEAALLAWPWPGNVRELRAVLAAARSTPTGRVGVEDLGEVGLRVPLLVTGQADPSRLEPPITRRVGQLLGGFSTRLDPPADRGRECLENAILHALDGRAITADALELLLASPWWGNLTQLHAEIGRLARHAGEAVTVADVRAVLRDLVRGDGRVPLLTLFAPSVRADGSVTGLADEHHEGALVIGRVESAHDLAPPGTDRRSVERRRWLHAQLGGALPAFLPFRHLVSLSRGQILVTRDDDGLTASLFPHAGLENFAGPLGGTLQRLEVGRGVRLGPAGRLRVLLDGKPYLELYVFLGPSARAAAELLLAEECGEGAGVTRLDGEGPRRARQLDPAERAVLVPIVVEVAVLACEFGPLALRRLQEAGTPAARSVHALLGGSKVAQAGARLYEADDDGPLCAETRSALAAVGLWPPPLGRLPIGIDRALRRVKKA